MKGFTLIEMLVSVAIFTVVMTIALGALLAMSAADRKAQSLKAVINNLNFTMDSMARNIRTGVYYHCGAAGTPTDPRDCPAGDKDISFYSALNQQTYYRLNTAGCPNTIGCIERGIQNGLTIDWAVLTSPEVVVTDLSSSGAYPFYVVGSCPTTGDTVFGGTCPVDTKQPQVIITLTGYVVLSATQQSQFHLQTTVTQRIYDQ